MRIGGLGRVVVGVAALGATAAGAVEWRAAGKDIVVVGLPADAAVVLRLIRPARTTAGLDAWLDSYADADAATIGPVVSARPMTAAGTGTRLTLREIKRGGPSTIAAYVGRLLPDGATAIGCRITVGQASVAAYSAPVLQLCLKQLDAIVAGLAAKREGATDAAAPPRPANGGLSTAAIAEVLFVFDLPTLDPFSTTMKSETDTYLLLRDGSFYYNFNVAPPAFDTAALRRANPRRWGHWQRSGNTVTLAWDDGRRSVLASKGGTIVKPCRPARPGETFEQRLAMSAGSSIGITGNQTQILTTRDLAFHADGSFGTRGGTVGLSPGTTTGTGSAASGRYRLDGYTMTLNFADGRVEQRMYCRVESGAIVVNGVQYVARR